MRVFGGGLGGVNGCGIWGAGWGADEKEAVRGGTVQVWVRSGVDGQEGDDHSWKLTGKPFIRFLHAV